MLIISNLKNQDIKYHKNKQIKKIICCEICSKKEFKIIQNIGRIDRVGVYGHLNVVICMNCGHKFVNPRFIDDFYIRYYLKKYRKIAFGFLNPTKNYLNIQRKRGEGVFNFYKKFLKKKGKMLDHGCASGGTMISWIQNGWDAYGMDPHTPSVNFGNKMLGLKIKNCFGEKVKFRKNEFDVVKSLGSLEHSYNVNKSLKEINRVLKKNGLLIIRWRSDKIIGSTLEYFNHNHYRYFTRKTWKLLLSKHNFKILSYTDKKLENYNSWEYILAQKTLKKTKVLRQSKKEIENIINNLKKRNLNYYKICLKAKNKKILDTKNFDTKIRFIKKNKLILLNNLVKSSALRFFYEMKKFYHIVNNNDNKQIN
tara:strand:- start:4793 stop:5890 length:1098 start_codon:yes stop_codon:yes gene_type:complete